MEQLQEMDLNGLSAPECEKIEVCIECEVKAKELVREKEVHSVPLKSRLSKFDPAYQNYLGTGNSHPTVRTRANSQELRNILEV